MRFTQFVTEKKGTFNLEKFKKDCAYYFEKMGSTHGYLFHGSRTMPIDYEIKKFVPRAGPRDSPNLLHKKVNDFYETKFHYPFRNGLFTSGKRVTASTYGVVGVVFPIGEFEWLCNTERKFHDLTGNYERTNDTLKANHPDLDYDERSELAINMTLDKLKASKMWHFNTDLPLCIENGNEIMLKCNSYYIFDRDGDTFQDVISPFTDNL